MEAKRGARAKPTTEWECSMNEMILDEAFFEMIYAFLASEVTSDVFCNSFTEIWMSRRDATYSKQNSWSERYDLQLIQKLEQGTLSKEEFGKQWNQIWGIAGNICFYEMIDRIHSACSVFYPTPTQEWQIDETGLRADITKALAEFEKCKQSSSK